MPSNVWYEITYHTKYRLSHSETTSYCNVVSHWLCPYQGYRYRLSYWDMTLYCDTASHLLCPYPEWYQVLKSIFLQRFPTDSSFNTPVVYVSLITYIGVENSFQSKSRSNFTFTSIYHVLHCTIMQCIAFGFYHVANISNNIEFLLTFAPKIRCMNIIKWFSEYSDNAYMELFILHFTTEAFPFIVGIHC